MVFIDKGEKSCQILLNISNKANICKAFSEMKRDIYMFIILIIPSVELSKTKRVISKCTISVATCRK